MKGLWKIVKIILVFALFLTAVSFVWYICGIAGAGDESPKIDFIDYMLYLIGYGDIEINDHYAQTVFSAISLLTLTLLSSVFTVSLFEIRSKAEIGKAIRIEPSDMGTFSSSVEIKTFGRDVYDVKVSMIAKVGDEVCSDEQYLPYVQKKSVACVRFKIAPGSVLYKYLRTAVKRLDGAPTLVMTLAYTDIENGQEYKSCRKFVYGAERSGFVFQNAESENAVRHAQSELRAYIENNVFDISLAKIAPINAENITISGGYEAADSKLTPAEAFFASVDMSGERPYKPDDFTMACLDMSTMSDWRKYADMGCHLEFDYMITSGMTLTVELKCGSDRKKIHTAELVGSYSFEHYSLPLRSLVGYEEQLSCVSELCFTVFYSDLHPRTPRGSFVIKNCALEVE